MDYYIDMIDNQLYRSSLVKYDSQGIQLHIIVTEGIHVAINSYY